MLEDQNISLPFSFAASQSWDGNAGSWSTFIVRIGTPPQDFSVLPSTNGQQTLVPVPQGCTSTDPSNCGALRGALLFHGAASNGFESNQSSTWVENGLFDLDIETNLNITGNGDYGFDTVGLEVENSGGLTLAHQVVAGIATKDYYLGQFGLGPKPSNFTTLADPIPSYMRNLADQNKIPSLSFGYTAGAKYRLNQVVGSLTLGGYDASRFTPSNISIPFAADDSRSLTVGVQSITASNTLRGVIAPLSTGVFFLIDSSVPDLWLPLSSCQLFEEAFGLTYDSRTDLYLVNDTTHASLLQLNPTVAIKLGMSKFDGPFVDVNLPYGAFDLQANFPFYSNATNYFPLRRAANSTQYTLGRTFLQEAYLVVDYEQSNFSVNQAVFLEPNPAHIVTIHSSNYTPTNGSSAAAAPQSHSLDHSAIAGIVVGIVAFVCIIIAMVLFVCHSKGLNLWKTSATPQIGVALPSLGPEATVDLSGPIWIPELVDDSSMRSPQELGGISSRIELSESTPPTYEMSDQSHRGTADTPQSLSNMETR